MDRTSVAPHEGRPAPAAFKGEMSGLEHFPAKWIQVRVKKMRPNKNPERFFDASEVETALAAPPE
jgi:hypothetical protein